MSKHQDVNQLAKELVGRMVERGEIRPELRERSEFYMAKELDRRLKERCRRVGSNIAVMLAFRDLMQPELRVCSP